ncbi:MAG: methyltransferase domain-containing protein [Erysipelotrichaceae bacterium]|nr:methyltransferase domain-containing protein [Erysipelotrichaceae bacterium]
MDLLCPVCKESLIKDINRYHCTNGHSFDIAKEGYLNLNLKSSVRSGDEKEMVRARKAFLEKRHYMFLRDRLNEIIDDLHPESLLDLGCGEGYYTQSFKAKEKLGMDLSKEALRLASRYDKSTMYVLKTIFDVPLTDNSSDLILTIFAPVSKEIRRVLKDDGFFILVRPDAKHLYELKETVYDSPYLNETEDIRIDGLELMNEYKTDSKAVLHNEELLNLFKMTPYYHKTSFEDFNKLAAVSELAVTFSSIIDLYKKI